MGHSADLEKAQVPPQFDPMPATLGKGDAASFPSAPDRKDNGHQPQSVCQMFRSQAALQLVTTTGFAMAFAWRAAVLAIVHPKHYTQDPSEVEDLTTLWALTSIVVVVFMVFICLLLKYALVLQRRAKYPNFAADSTTAFLLQARIQSIDAIVCCGLAFAVAAQIDTAVQASIPQNNPISRIVYLLSLVAAICLLMSVLRCVGRSREGVAANATSADGDARVVTLGMKVADAVFSGAAYVVALATLGVSDSLFGLDDVSTSKDLTFIATYAGGSVAVATVVLACLACADSSEALAIQKDATSSKGMQLPSAWARTVRKFLGKVFAMCAVLACYALIYVALMGLLCDGQASVYDPLPVKGALILMASAFGVSLLGGLLLACISKTAVASLASMDTEAIPGAVDDFLLASLESLVKTTSSTILESFAWLTGFAVYAVAMAVCVDLVKDANRLTNIVAMCSMSLILSSLAVIVAVCFTPTSGANDKE